MSRLPWWSGFRDRPASERDRPELDSAAALLDDVVLEEDRATVGGISYNLGVEGLEEEKADPRTARAVVSGEGAVTAIMPGKIIRLLIATGDQVAEGDVVCILEAMKMENELKAPKAGTVRVIHVQPGQDVEMGAVLAEIE